MNRAFLIILIPAVLVGAAYVAFAAYHGVRLDPRPFLGGGLAFAAALAGVHLYRRRKPRRPP